MNLDPEPRDGGVETSLVSWRHLMFETGGAVGVFRWKGVREGNQRRREGRVVFAAPFVKDVGEHDAFPGSGAPKVLNNDPPCHLCEREMGQTRGLTRRLASAPSSELIATAWKSWKFPENLI